MLILNSSDFINVVTGTKCATNNTVMFKNCLFLSCITEIHKSWVDEVSEFNLKLPSYNHGNIFGMKWSLTMIPLLLLVLQIHAPVEPPPILFHTTLHQPFYLCSMNTLHLYHPTILFSFQTCLKAPPYFKQSYPRSWLQQTIF